MENLKGLSDEILRVRLRESLALERQAVDTFLTFLAEYDDRRAYEVAGYSSLFTFLVEGLHISEPAAAKRVAAVRLIRRWPNIKARIRTGSIHLTALYLISKHLTEENHEKVLDDCHHRSKRWVEDYLLQEFQVGNTPHKRDVVRPIVSKTSAQIMQTQLSVSFASQSQPLFKRNDVGDLKAAVVLSPVPAPTPGAVRARVRISADMEADALADLQRAKELLGARDFGEVIGKALKNYLRKIDPMHTKLRIKNMSSRTIQAPVSSDPSNGESNSCIHKRPNTPSTRQKCSRYVSILTKAEVHHRDGGQCTYVSPDGQRCSARSGLQLEHRIPFAKGGSHMPDNLELHCPAHNRMKARQVFGEDFIAKKARRAGEIGHVESR